MEILPAKPKGMRALDLLKLRPLQGAGYDRAIQPIPEGPRLRIYQLQAFLDFKGQCLRRSLPRQTQMREAESPRSDQHTLTRSLVVCS